MESAIQRQYRRTRERVALYRERKRAAEIAAADTFLKSPKDPRCPAPGQGLSPASACQTKGNLASAGTHCLASVPQKYCLCPLALSWMRTSAF
jgi:hypothetical protein